MIGKSELLSTPEVVAHAARLSMVDIISYSQDNSFAAVAAAKPLLRCNYMESDSSSSSVIAAMAASAGGKRVFTTLSYPDLHSLKEAALMRVPIVIFAASHPENIMALRDAGCIIVFCESHQELLDTIIRAFRLAEDDKVLLPCIVAWDGPLSYFENLLLPSDQMIKNLLPQIRLPHRLDTKTPSHLGIREKYTELRQQQQKAMESVFKVAVAIDDSWNKKMKRSWPAVEKYHADDAELLLVTYGYHCSTAKAVVGLLRSQGKKAGLVRIRAYRPFPAHALALLKDKKVAVLDFASAPGAASPLFQEIKPLSKLALSFVSLEKYLSEKDFLDIFSKLEKAEKEETFWI